TAQDGNWDPIETGKKALQLLTKYRNQGGVQGAYGMADYMAAAIIQSANQLGIKSGSAPGDLVVTASNCTPTGIPLMEKGELWGNATQSPIEESEAAAARIIEFLEGKEVPHNTTVEEERFTSENYKEFVPLCAEWPN
ncbi:MAG TPA: substrate-binding domain-containing protein, partial [Solirubrobacterales bacterium]|nr:substrate-binding domain-containing protein [Solirubrobacterales bacterium]